MPCGPKIGMESLELVIRMHRTVVCPASLVVDIMRVTVFVLMLICSCWLELEVNIHVTPLAKGADF